MGKNYDKKRSKVIHIYSTMSTPMNDKKTIFCNTSLERHNLLYSVFSKFEDMIIDDPHSESAEPFIKMMKLLKNVSNKDLKKFLEEEHLKGES